MARVIEKIRTSRLQASTLIEVIIAMTILLTVFAVGMMIYANLSRSQTSQQRKKIQFQMDNLLKNYSSMESLEEEQEQEVIIDSIAYSIILEPFPDIPDRIKVKIYAQHLHDGLVLDSLIGITDPSAVTSTRDDNFR